MKSLTLFALCSAAGIFTSFAQQQSSYKLAVKWETVDKIENAKNPVSKIIIENKGDKAINLSDYELYFNFMQRIHANSLPASYKLQHRNGDFYQLSFQEANRTLQQRDTLEIHFAVNGRFINFTDGPGGLFLQNKSNKQDIIQLSDHSFPTREHTSLETLAVRYAENAKFKAGAAQPIIPAVKSFSLENGSYKLLENSSFTMDATFDSNLFSNALKNAFSLNLKELSETKKAAFKIQKDASLATEGYKLHVSKEGIDITASTDIGVFYAIQSLRSLADAKQQIPFIDVTDEPRFEYRGLSLDVARNFHSKEEVLKVLDLMARYKLNKFHFHFSDDEGWRLQIPSLPELTQVGARRGIDFAENRMLQPSYNSGAYPKEGQFYSKADFIEILKFAAARHIQVIPEVETPGHARAAIKSMEYRYATYLAKGEKEKAEEYRLLEPTDASSYSSAQYWSDNVMNPALPATYRFLNTVIADIASFYKEAGLPFEKISLGGDETPKGSWSASPRINELLKNQQLTSHLEVWPYYIDEINKICKQHNLQMAGWEEMGMKNSGKGMQVNPEAKLTDIQLDVWNNSIGWGQEDLAYKLANAGYPVVFTSATHNYFDLTWNADFQEPGHWWAGKINIDRTYGFIPNNFYINIDQKVHGEPVPEGYFNDKIQLTETGKKNMLGIKAALWSEKITNPERLEYMLFPRVLALADRAWSAEKEWEKGSTFNKEAYQVDFSAFMKKLATSELPKLDTWNKGYAYRLAVVGVKVEGNLLQANTDYPGVKIYYTADGSEPTLKSKIYKQALTVKQGNTYKFRVITPQGREGRVETVKL